MHTSIHTDYNDINDTNKNVCGLTATPGISKSGDQCQNSVSCQGHRQGLRKGGARHARNNFTGSKARSIEQLVLPTRCRQAVMGLAHNIPMAGHLGRRKTAKRVFSSGSTGLECFAMSRTTAELVGSVRNLRPEALKRPH